ncbi:ankyrin repeat domain-containing protein 37 [Latimeria chalumnae]|uniref:Ankyrin repeat domain 37 n=1 Tax=Latimeria chalumnae TaxID=7897 RepID=H3A4G3_LATCH|nr:PREDICTED: ankyrin repeat domain-containing protein 37 [Latimeria chalumnae]|eukprot:XP_006011937.1 PREDICTED: ankyrin repeat domain-containing protein 37 [Latimeria chalumnae]
MLLLDCDFQVDNLSDLLQSGTAVNLTDHSFSQSPVHLAACGDQAFCLLWLLQSGGDINQQDCSGEAPVHKAAKTGSLECIRLLVASAARLDLCNKSGQTAEDLAWSHGFLECAKFLAAVKEARNLKSCGQTCISYTNNPCGRGMRAHSLAGQKRGRTGAGVEEKRLREDDLMS